MSRNVNEIQKSIFVKLSAGLELKDNDISKASIFLGKDEFQLLANGIKIKISEKISPTNTFTFVRIDECKYLLVTGDFADFSIEECMEVDDIIPVFLLAIVDLNIPCLKDISGHKLLDEVFIGEKKRLCWSSIAEYFPKMCLYQLKDSWDDDVDSAEYYLRTLIASICLSNQQCLSLSFNDQTIQKYVDLINSGDTNVPIDNILHSLLANNWKFSFLDVYRIIEHLFDISWIHKYQVELGCTKTVTEIRGAFKKLNVETHEDRCMEYLFTHIKQTTTDVLTPIVHGVNVGKYIYQMRNEIVHFQKSDNKINQLDGNTWNLLIQFMLMSIMELYAFFRNQIDELSE